MLTIKNYYYDNPMSASKGFYFFEGCSMYLATEKPLVYEFKIRDKDCMGLCTIYLSREITPEGKYPMWGVIDGKVYRTTETRYVDKNLITNWHWVATDMNCIISQILKIK